MAKKCKIGDVIEIPIRHGLAYAQFSHLHPRYNALLRVLPGKFKSRPSDMMELVGAKEMFVTFFPLQAALNQGIVHFVTNLPVPRVATAFPLFRTGVEDPKTGRVKDWWLWDGEKEWKVGHINAEQRKLPLRGIWNDTLLIERIETDWTPQSDPS
jgi:hypothetical protein